MTTARPPANAILQALDDDSRARLELVPVELLPGQEIHHVGSPERCAYFPVTTVISLVSSMADGATAEVAMVGREGIVGLTGMLGMCDSATSAVTQLGGIALRSTTTALRQLRLHREHARLRLDAYVQSRLVQVAQVAACNRLHTIEHRLARWLLDLHDRAGTDQFRTSHQSMADMLGVHRPTITIGLRDLQQAGAITHKHRLIAIVDRACLEALSCECHSVLHREFDRALAWPRARPIGPGVLAPKAEANVAGEAMREIAGRLLIANLQEQEARERAEAANHSKDHFLAMVSHELRTPLQAILGWCTVLAKQQHRVESGLEVIARNTRVQLRLINDLMDSARMTAGTLQVERTTVDLSGVVQAAVDSVLPMADAKGIAVRVECPPGLPSLPADPSRLQQVMVNLLTNAVKFSESGGQIDVAVTATDTCQQVSIRDSGRGISAAVLPRVFERFEQGDNGGAHGLGLGLSIARALVELHGGTIAIDSAGLGRGTVCTVRLPAVAAVNPSLTPQPSGLP